MMFVFFNSMLYLHKHYIVCMMCVLAHMWHLNGRGEIVGI